MKARTLLITLALLTGCNDRDSDMPAELVNTTSWGLLGTIWTGTDDESVTIDLAQASTVIVQLQASIGVTAGTGTIASYRAFVGDAVSDPVTVDQDTGGTHSLRWEFSVPAGAGIAVGGRIEKTGGGSATWSDQRLIVLAKAKQ